MRCVLLSCLALLTGAACAKGVGEDDPRGRDSAGVDAAGIDGGARDTGGRDAPSQPDTGPPCVDDEVGDVCAEATELGTIMPLGRTMVEGKLPLLSDTDWYHVTFPLAGAGESMRGVGMPEITLAGDSTMVMEVLSTCTMPVGCDEGTASEITSYSFVDDQSDLMVTDPTTPGPAEPFMTRDTPWPEELYIKVSRRGGPADCSDYVLTVSR